MTLDCVQPTEQYDYGKCGETINSEQAKMLVRANYNSHAFICNATDKFDH
ncbi:hypothetical protein [Pediococcus parvulus]|nr:hypothetical protein [Pediococcus parvulus]